MRGLLSLGQQNAIRLALVFIVFELLVALAVIQLLMLPMARRAANDLAGLMVLSAQTWNELPPGTRPTFERELRHAHGLVMMAKPPAGPVASATRGPYLLQLEAELTRRTHAPVKVLSLDWQGTTWHWAALPVGEQTWWIGFSHARFGPQPLAAGALTLLLGLALAILAAWWLSRRTVEPLRQFDLAAAALGRGETPELLPESGPRELAALARRFNSMAHQVRDLLEARTTLLVGLSHDLRTPLARMRLALEMLQRKPDPAWIAQLERDIEETNQLVGELLELARGLGHEHSETIPLKPFLDRLIAPARAEGVAIVLTCPERDLTVPPNALRRLLENLIGNARRHAPGAPLHLLALDEGDCVHIGLLDQGPGIPADQLDKVFHPFHRVETSRSRANGGSGLGLAIVRQLALANGWQVWLENRPEGGLAAWVALPDQAPDPGAPS